MGASCSFGRCLGICFGPSADWHFACHTMEYEEDTDTWRNFVPVHVRGAHACLSRAHVAMDVPQHRDRASTLATSHSSVRLCDAAPLQNLQFLEHQFPDPGHPSVRLSPFR